jgi:uncharacterized protein YecE (DUF72 family)
MSCGIRIGTSGYHYQHGKGSFYPKTTSANEMLTFYAKHFDTVELNNNFYLIPTEAGFDEWRTSTPSNFVFAVKAGRFLTHNKKLKDPQSALDRFLPRIRRLSTKLGPVLFQLPPRWRVNYERLQVLLQLLPTSCRYVFELRDTTWINPDIQALLARFHAAFCIYQLAGFRFPLTVTTDLAYLRLHGPGPLLSDERSEQRLASNDASKPGAAIARFVQERAL